MAGPKITITITEANGEQQVINADYFIGCVHEEGDTLGELSAIAIGRSTIRQIALAKSYIDDLFYRIADLSPELIDEYLSIDPKNMTSVVEHCEHRRVPKEGLT